MEKSKLTSSTKKNEQALVSLLQVIDMLEVGQARLEKRKVVTSYTVSQNGSSDVFELEYSFDEDVFEPNSQSDLNLANMMIAQVALNYGLFCKEIVFQGNFDKQDRQFIEDMAENTAREIYVNKILQPNPFLKDALNNINPVKLPKYCLAKIKFGIISSGQEFAAWQTDSKKHAILSSGGKDSLLSFGLMRELGLETHSIFVNESGRHWFTALNAFRNFKELYPETGRVWTNSDRLFSWMLRHLPFIRRDFFKVRSDEYPIRLWTVAVFLFGVLPLLKKRGIGRLIIGDEYDTTVRLNYHGITHYNGLYDQSLYFDNTVTRYFMRKKWQVSQFSILRPLSELLIEKVLATRYPELQKNQLSCHAAHVEGERVFPCGKCEKCRRIVAMLSAIGVNPQNCGYNQEQIDKCLRDFADKGIHQEAAGEAHLIHLLIEKNIVIPKKKKTKPHPEILKLRIDRERSPFSAIPVDLRQPLHNLLLQHTQGTVRKQGRLWVDITPSKEADFLQPYEFESATTNHRMDKMKSTNKKESYVLGKLTWPEAKKRLKEVDIALLPVGAIEQHGPHLPLDTDAFDAEYLSMAVAKACSDPKPLVLPLIPYGVSYHHEDFSGTLSVTNETLAQFVYEIGVNAARQGITKLIIINGHGGNASTLQFAAQMINRDAHIFTCVDTGETSDTDIDAITETHNDVHAGEIETSTSLAIRPELVQMKKAKKFVPNFSGQYLNFSSDRSVDWNARTAKISPTGTLGDPTKATKEKGEKIWEIMIKNLTELVEQLKGLTLNEIYEKRY